MRKWTPEERQAQSELIRQWKPWEQSTGARTAQGKARSSQNALKHGARSKDSIQSFKEIRKFLSNNREIIIKL